MSSEASPAANRQESRLAELEQTCSAPASDFSQFVWCHAANEAVRMLHQARDALLEIRDRDWRDEGGRIAAALAEDGLNGTGRFA